MPLAFDIVFFWLPLLAAVALMAWVTAALRRSSLRLPVAVPLGLLVVALCGWSIYALVNSRLYRWKAPLPPEAEMATIVDPPPGSMVRKGRCGGSPQKDFRKPFQPSPPEYRRHEFETPTAGPVLIERVEARFTPAAWEKCVSGSVVAEVVIGSDGKVVDGRLLSSLPHGLDQEAAKAVAQWRYEPAVIGDRRIPAMAVVFIRFDPNNEEQRPAE